MSVDKVALRLLRGTITSIEEQVKNLKAILERLEEEREQ